MLLTSKVEPWSKQHVVDTGIRPRPVDFDYIETAVHNQQNDVYARHLDWQDIQNTHLNIHRFLNTECKHFKGIHTLAKKKLEPTRIDLLTELFSFSPVTRQGKTI